MNIRIRYRLFTITGYIFTIVILLSLYPVIRLNCRLLANCT